MANTWIAPDNSEYTEQELIDSAVEDYNLKNVNGKYIAADGSEYTTDELRDSTIEDYKLKPVTTSFLTQPAPSAPALKAIGNIPVVKGSMESLRNLAKETKEKFMAPAEFGAVEREKRAETLDKGLVPSTVGLAANLATECSEFGNIANMLFKSVVKTLKEPLEEAPVKTVAGVLPKVVGMAPEIIGAVASDITGPALNVKEGKTEPVKTLNEYVTNLGRSAYAFPATASLNLIPGAILLKSGLKKPSQILSKMDDIAAVSTNRLDDLLTEKRLLNQAEPALLKEIVEDSIIDIKAQANIPAAQGVKAFKDAEVENLRNTLNTFTQTKDKKILSNYTDDITKRVNDYKAAIASGIPKKEATALTKQIEFLEEIAQTVPTTMSTIRDARMGLTVKNKLESIILGLSQPETFKGQHPYTLATWGIQNPNKLAPYKIGEDIINGPAEIGEQAMKQGMAFKDKAGNFILGSSEKSLKDGLVRGWKEVVLSQPGYVLGNVISDVMFGLMQDPKRYIGNYMRSFDPIFKNKVDELLPRIVKSTLPSEIKTAEAAKTFKDDILKSYTSIVGKDRRSWGSIMAPVSGVLSGGAAGFVLGGPIGLAIGGTLGAASAPIIPVVADYLGRVGKLASLLSTSEVQVNKLISRLKKLPEDMPYEDIPVGVQRDLMDYVEKLHGREAMEDIFAGPLDQVDPRTLGNILEEANASIPEIKKRVKNLEDLLRLGNNVEAAKEVEKFFYDYSKFMDPKWSLITPFPSFMKHSTELFTKYPLYRPGLTLLFNNIEGAARNYSETPPDYTDPNYTVGLGEIIGAKVGKKVGATKDDVPPWMEAQAPAVLPGNNAYIAMGTKSPFGFQSEMATALAKAIKSGRVSMPNIAEELGIGPANAPLTQAGVMLAGYDPFTMRKYRVQEASKYSVSPTTGKVVYSPEVGASIIEAAARFGVPGYAKAGTVMTPGYYYSGEPIISRLLGNISTPAGEFTMSGFKKTELKKEQEDNIRKVNAIRVLTGIPIYPMKEYMVSPAGLKSTQEAEFQKRIAELERQPQSEARDAQIQVLKQVIKKINSIGGN